MKNVLYIGNALSNKGKTSTTIESLGAHLRDRFNVKIASDKSNKFLRLLDMVRLVLVNRTKADVVLMDTYSTFNFYYALVISQLCRILNLKYIPILHGGNLEYRLKNNPRLSNYIFSNAYKMVAPSHFLKSVFETYGYYNVEFIPNGIDLDIYRFYNRPINGIKLLWVRSFTSIYNPELAILVMQKLKEIGHDAQLTMVGPDIDGTLNTVKASAEEKGLNVSFTGKLSKQEWLKRSENSNVFINTTNLDNTPVSVIEAMAVGLPIVSTNVGGLPFLISNKEEGILVPPNNANAMAEVIINLMKDQDLKNKIIINARSKVEKFSWQSVIPQWETLLS